MIEKKEIKVLIVCSGNAGYISPFIIEQADSLKELGINIDFYLIQGKGIIGYLKNYFAYKKKIKQFKPDLVHAHYGLSGLFAALQRRIPVITTFHGNDINPINKIGHSTVKRISLFSFLALKFSSHNILVSQELFQISKQKKGFSIIPCGVKMDVFFERPKNEAREALNLNDDKKHILFSSSFNNPVKNYPLAKKAIDQIDNSVLIEMKGYTRNQIALLFSSCDVLLVTSNNESGPLVVKEAMACGCPIVSTDVGDVKWVIGNTEGCYLTSFDPNDIAEKIKLALRFSDEKAKTSNRERIFELGLDSITIAKKIVEVYKNVLEKR